MSKAPNSRVASPPCGGSGWENVHTTEMAFGLDREMTSVAEYLAGRAVSQHRLSLEGVKGVRTPQAFAALVLSWFSRKWSVVVFAKLDLYRASSYAASLPSGPGRHASIISTTSSAS